MRQKWNAADEPRLNGEFRAISSALARRSHPSARRIAWAPRQTAEHQCATEHIDRIAIGEQSPGVVGRSLIVGERDIDSAQDTILSAKQIEAVIGHNDA
ncbi:hypothetical protein [Phenylobacterium sp.]|uniref:hypothetical protein n=1 Tax=Phenylobacterium sp. TaxID=1871053 RepID=UPI0027366763|nr:hypothetical protein [Phenylobacterium sp.]MDP3659336.1 hypothetical protein [Phenylobacterium sp.]